MSNLSIAAIDELRRNARSMVRELGLLNDAYFEIGVTLAERHLLIELAGSPAPTMKEVAERLLLDKSTISRLISKAVKKGYVACITDKKDKRKRFLQITEVGKQTLQAFEPIAFNQTKQALLTLTPKEIETVYKGIALYAKGLRNSRTKVKSDRVGIVDVRTESLSAIFSCLNQMGYALRLFNSTDENELYEIFRSVVDSGSQFPYGCSSIEEFRRQFLNSQSKVYVCHSLKGEVIGGFYLRPNFTGRSSHIANAAYMVHSAYRGKGVGSLLIKASLYLAKELGFRSMQFNMVLSQNPLAVKLYQRLGFDITGVLPEAVRNHDGSYQDGYVMYRKL